MSRRKKSRRSNNVVRYLLVLFSIMPVGCLCAIFFGLSITWYISPTRFTDNSIAQLDQAYADEVVLMAAADYAQHEDIERAQSLLSELEVANQAQYVSLVAERLIRQHRGPIDEEIKNVVNLADALNVSTAMMIAFVSSPTPTPTETPLPTATSTATPVIIPTNTPAPLEGVESNVAAEVEPTAVPPTETPVPEPTATPVPPPTEPPPPPTEPPPPPAAEVAAAEPEAQPAAEEAPAAEAAPPEHDFIITKQRLLTKEENGGCMGMHSIFINVVDANGNPIKGAEIVDTWGNPGPVTGHKGDDQPGLAMWDLFKNGHYIFVKSDPTAGRPVTSEQSVMLSSNDWEIGIPRLIEAGYCADEASCRRDWNSGVFGEGANALCWGHYSWEITFQRTW